MDPLLHFTLAVSMALLFAAAAAQKLLAWAEWPEIVRQYRLLPAALVMPVALVLPVTELATAVLLLSSRARAGAVTAAGLLLVFAFAMLVNLARGRTAIDCGCFGGRLRQHLAAWMVGRNLVLAGSSLALLVPAAPRGLSALEQMVAVGCSLTLAFLYPVLGVVLRRLPAASRSLRTR